MVPNRGVKGSRAKKAATDAPKRKPTASRTAKKAEKPKATKTAGRATSKKLPGKQGPSIASDDSGEVDEHISDDDNNDVDASGPSRPLPIQVLKKGYCLFCWDQSQTEVHHSIPTTAELRELEKTLQKLQRKVRIKTPEHFKVPEESGIHPYKYGQLQREAQAQGQTPNTPPQTHNDEEELEKWNRFNVLQWQLERARELHKKGFGSPFDLWIDHLTLTQMLRDGWTYQAVRQKLPEGWIQDPEVPEFLQDKRSRFPPGTHQPGDIEQEVVGPSDEELNDEMDDHDQNALVDNYRLRNMETLPSLAMDDTFDEIGENLSREAAANAIHTLRKNQIPELMKTWRDKAKPFTHRESKLQMKDYAGDVHTFKQPGSESAPSLEAYKAITNIAFSMQAAQRLWKKNGVTDEGYSKLLRDGFGQLADLRKDMEEDGVKGLPPLLDLPQHPKPRQRKPLEPFVIDHSMDRQEGRIKQTYAYSSSRPLGPMLSENKDGGSAEQAKVSREELVAKNMELDQLVDE